MDSEKRRDKRYRFQIPASIIRYRATVPALTGDVGFRGVLLRTDAPPPLRELLLVRCALPPRNEQIELHAMAVWNVPPGVESRDPGVGVQFYAVPAATQRRWNEFVRWVEKYHPESTDQTVPAAPGLLDPVRRLHERIDVALGVRLQDSTGSRALTTRYVSRGGLYLWMSPPADVGTDLDLEIVHPSTGASLSVKAVVRAIGMTGGGRTGVGMEFVGVDEPKRDELMSFVAAALEPSKADTPVLVAPGNPNLDRPAHQEDLVPEVALSNV